MARVASIATVCYLIGVPGSDVDAQSQRTSHLVTSVSLVSACGASTPGVAAATDPVELLRITQVSCGSTVPFRIQVVDDAANAAAPATQPRIVRVEF